MTKQEYNKAKAEIESLKSDENIKSIATIVHMIDNEKILLSSYDLTKAVIKQLGYDKGNARELLEVGGLLEDIANYGARNTAGGGFVYNKDLIKFFNDNRDDILKLLSNEVKEYGYSNELEFLNNSYGKKEGIEYTLNDILEASKTNNDENIFDWNNVKNLKCCLSLFTAEVIANRFVELKENPDLIADNSTAKAKTMINNRINKELKNLKNEYTKSNERSR